MGLCESRRRFPFYGALGIVTFSRRKGSWASGRAWASRSSVALVFFAFTPGSFGQKHTIRLGHIATTDHPTHQATLKLAEWVSTRTQGAIKVQVYPNSQLGDERDVQEGMQLGTVEMAITGTAIVGKFQPEYNIIPLPYLFKDQAAQSTG